MLMYIYNNILYLYKFYYRSVHDIDLFTGGLAENKLPGAVVGPTFACLLGQQFQHVRRGDRYWYENDLPPSSFSLEQLAEIRKASLARIICDNSDEADFVQPQTMMVSDPYLNAFQYCSNIQTIDFQKWKNDVPLVEIPAELLRETINRAKRQARNIFESELKSISKSSSIAPPRSPQAAHLGFLRPKRHSQKINNHSLILELTSTNVIKSLLRGERDREVGRSLRFEVQDLMDSLPKVDLSDYFEDQIASEFHTVHAQCLQDDMPCDHTFPFRGITGWCNNLKHPDYGTSYRTFERVLPPKYEDGISIPRQKSKSGRFLPSGRVISTSIHFDVSNPHVRYALATMQWGQFLDHDLTFTPMNMGPNEAILNCKSCDSQRNVHPECWPILIPRGDSYFPALNVSSGERQCLHFVRSLNGQTKLGPREQMNQITSFIDGSNVYGSDLCEAAALRTFVGGRLNVTKHPIKGHKDLLPQTSMNVECKAPTGFCFRAGDVRSSEQPALATIHTIFLREHNRLVSKLQKINPKWTDEQLYQNGRKIVGAIMQKVTFDSFLPRILGWDYIHKFELNLLQTGYAEDYNSNCNPTIFNEFAAAVFRFGHSLLKPSFQRLGRSFSSVDKPIKLRDAFFNSDMLYGRMYPN